MNVLPRLVSIAGCALILGTLPFSAAAQAPSWTLHELAPGVYAHIVDPPAHTAQYATSLVVVNEDHVVLVDSGAGPAAARALLERIRTVTDLPVTRVVLTHRHWDHVFGTQVFRDAYPDLRVVAHPATWTYLAENGAADRDEQIQQRRDRVDRLNGMLASGKAPDGSDLTADQRTQIDAALEQTNAEVEDLTAVEIVVPTDSLRTQAVLKDGGREIRIIHPGPAHTDGDLVVYLPEERILATGDLVEQGQPWFGDGSVVGSAWATDRLALLDVEQVVPGHARVQADATLWEGQTAFYRAVADAARGARTADRTLDAEQERRALDSHAPAFEPAEGLRAAPFGQFLTSTLEQAAAELDSLSGPAAACGAPEARAFDFWVGEWEVEGPSGAIVGHNRIESILGGCALLENWTGGSGNVGRSFNIFDRTRGVWHQTWVDNFGTLLRLEGGVEDGAMVMRGETVGPDGSVTLQRITWSVQDEEGREVRQLWESSTDGGETWTVAFNGLYRKRSP